MKKSGLFLILTFINYLLGQGVWVVALFSSEPLFGSAFYEELLLIQIFNSTGVLGLISGICLYRENKQSNQN